MNSLDERISHSETRIFKAVFPNTTNHYDTLFGGTAMHMMDEAAFICATRFSRKKMVTVSTDKIDFTKPIPQGTIVELVAQVEAVGRTSCTVKVEIFMEDMYSFKRERVVVGKFALVAIGENKKPIPILD
ncbi:MAG: acyl-CoA thioesterase [Bacteroidia bacterium]|nr:acyl-CoA thioesterase [Bacteroidia bacterium]NNM24168.1 acyl-CoA thioesterase [Flavobacteriaceae bacterium]